jgi:hypothetical protein
MNIMALADKYGMTAIKLQCETVLEGMVASRVLSGPKTLLQVMAKASALNALKLMRACELAIMAPITEVNAQ